MTVFRALATVVSVEIDEDMPFAALAHALVSRYPRADRPELHYRVGAAELLRNGDSLAVNDPCDVVPLFEMDLYEQVLARTPHGWILHAAAVVVEGRALVLCGASGAGKTTLALSLASRGLRLLTEEVVWIDRHGMVRGLPRPLHVRTDDPQRTRIPPGWDQLPYPLRARDGRMQANVLAIPPLEALELEAVQLHTIVRVGHGPDWPVHLRRSPHHVALERLWDRSLRQDDSGLETAVAVLQQHTTFELSSTREDEALQLLAPLLK